MNTKHYTSIEQSKKLLKLGLNTETADMHFIKMIRDTDIVYIPELLYDDPLSENDYPCWSLGALLEVMPEQITYSDFKPFPIGLFKGNKEGHSKYGHYWIQYFATDSGGAHVQTNGHSPLEVAYSMVVWLLENGYIKKDE